MPQAARDLSVGPVHSTELNCRLVSASVAIGAAGAVDPTIAGYRVPGGVTVTNTGAGTFSVVYPISPNVTIIPFVELSAAATVLDATLTAKSPTAGTATIATKNQAGTNTNPASGDLIGLLFIFLPMGQVS